MDRDADLNTPASTPSGRIDGMVVAGIIGKGAPELVRFWGEPPLVREPDVYLFGIERLDLPEQEFLSKSPMRHMLAMDVQRKSATAAAKDALAHLHSEAREYLIHLDTDLISHSDFSAVNVPAADGGLPFADVKAALTEAVRSSFLVGLTISQYNPDKDPDGSGAQKLVDLLAETLPVRLEPEQQPVPSTSEPTVAPSIPDTSFPETPEEKVN
jgi:arginase